jgi:hypothetical protein
MEVDSNLPRTAFCGIVGTSNPAVFVMPVERFEPTLGNRESGARGDAIASPKARQ